MKNASEIWKQSIPYIKQNVSETGFATTFEKLKPAYIEDNIFYFTTTNKLYKDMFDGIYDDITKKALYEVTGESFEIEVTVGENKEKITEKKPKSNQTFEGSISLNSKFTFENFIVGSNSEFAYAAAYSITQGPVRDDYNPLFLYGGSGLGKTHLLHAIGNEILKNDSERTILYVTAETFMNEFINSIKNETNAEFRNKFRNIDVLLIDDIQFLAGKEGTQVEFFHTFNDLINKNKQIVIASDRPPKDIAQLDERLRTRFSSRFMIDIQPPDFETRIAILHSKVTDDYSGEISDEIFNLIAQQIKTKIRELEGAIKTIIAYSDVSKKEIDYDTANDILKRYFVDNQKRKITAEYIIKAVEKYFNLSENTIIGTRREKTYAIPR
ncbi:MAG: chromosomal replication initiator protein DnaA, partial [Clostridia bacterium]|nr:chromosomal replication initiator protein DnaA [Clostridia bacterium]